MSLKNYSYPSLKQRIHLLTEKLPARSAVLDLFDAMEELERRTEQAETIASVYYDDPDAFVSFDDARASVVASLNGDVAYNGTLETFIEAGSIIARA